MLSECSTQIHTARISYITNLRNRSCQLVVVGGLNTLVTLYRETVSALICLLVSGSGLRLHQSEQSELANHRQSLVVIVRI